jgi:type IV pilus assembly protein PilV
MIPTSRTQAEGFSLIEVLVALAIITAGLLGIAGMQALAIGGTQTSRTESLVAVAAQSLAGAMQANSGYWLAGLFPAGAFTVTGSAISDSTLNSQNTNCVSSSCTPGQMAGYDLQQWGTNLQTLIPSAAGTITCQAASPSVCTITVNWTARASAAVNSGTVNSASTAMSYTLVSQF